ncbi:PAS domain S-box protein [Flavobacterium reichenbachii]|uniref:PAS domain S-box protein n=1 Tax=Flavobacterium reichenbachii TaxID=362418 RepID=UPI000689A42F|nr:PAS domain S-box protein [Flavobacterium reichenbachii]OXB17898.1 PAS domain-containing sensor histidine kinase [Flavobacterium reichenbachii]
MELLENKNLFEAVFNSVSNGIIVMQSVYNDKGTIEDFSLLFLNSSALNLIGNIDYKGRKYSDIYPQVKGTDILEKFIETSETGITSNFESSYNSIDKKQWFKFTVIKQDQLLVVTTEDITEKKQAALLLDNTPVEAEKQKRLFDSITNNTPDLVYVFDLSYKFTYANKALLSMWGKTAENAIGYGLRENGYEEWHALMHEREIDEVVATKKRVRGTVSFPHAELGSRVYDYILAPVFNEDGEVEAVAGTTRDITEIKQAGDKLQKSEIRFRTMIEQSPIAMLLSKGEDVIIESVNKPMLQLMNKSSADEVLGKKMIEVLPELTEQPVLQTVINVQKKGVSFRGNEMPVDLLIKGRLERLYFNFSYDFIQETDESSAVLHMAVDVTEQVLARRKLEDSESRLKSMIDQTPAPTLVLMGDDLVIEQINKPMLKMIGRGEEIVGMALIDVLPELKGQYVWEQVQNVYRKGISFHQSEVHVPHNRKGVIHDYYYNLAYRPLIEDKQITGMIQVAIDVTEQVMARKKLEESETRFRALVNASSDVVYRINADFTVMRNLEGRGFISDAGDPIVNWMENYIHSNDRAKVVKTIEEAIANKTTFELEHRIISDGGIIKWAVSRAIPILDDQNNIIEWFGATSDITPQKELQDIIKESEEKFRQLANLVPQIIWTAQPDGYLDYYNKRWYELVGVDEKEAVEKGWEPFTHPDDLKSAIDAWYGSVKSGNLFQHEFRIKNARTNEYQWFLGKALPIRDKEGIITKWFGTCTDIHEQRSITERLESLVTDRTKELQRSNEDLQQFAHVASHDLKEPVRKIKTFTSRLEEHLDGTLDKTAMRYMERIHVATDRMFNMIDGVLAYSKINADLQQNTLVDLNEVIKNIEIDLEVSLQKTEGKIHYHNLPKLEGALVLLYQLFYNLINNSIKFAKIDTPPQITIGSEIKEGNFVLINVKDNGIGFAPDQAERIFETFSRLNSKDSYEGTGLGLSLCKKIVERHGGTITAIGSINGGAEFIIMLPIKQKENNI